jgi:hypothetical protein
MKFCELVLIFLAQAGSETKHQLHALDFVQPVVQSRIKFVFLGSYDSGRAEWAEPGEGQGAVAVDGAIAGGGAPFIVFGQEYDNGHAASRIDAKFRRQLAFLGPLNKTQIDFSGIGFGDSIYQRALLDAIAAPDAAEDQDFHFAHEAVDELLLRVGQVRGVVHLRPATLLLFRPGLKVAGIRKPCGKLAGKVGGIRHGSGIVHRAISIC